ncbi:hypothetical protein ABLT31_25710 [Ammoniphilus sp. 3BR4]
MNIRAVAFQQIGYQMTGNGSKGYAITLMACSDNQSFDAGRFINNGQSISRIRPKFDHGPDDADLSQCWKNSRSMTRDGGKDLRLKISLKSLELPASTNQMVVLYFGFGTIIAFLIKVRKEEV